jgi:hypothetical protein
LALVLQRVDGFVGMTMRYPFRLIALLALIPAWGESAGAAGASPINLAPHRAIYDLRLLRAAGKRPIVAARGRILYDFTGNDCEGYSLQFRQVSELDSGEGNVAVSDLQASTWEDGAAKAFRFNSTNTLDMRLVDNVDGAAKRAEDKIDVHLAKPQNKNFDINAPIVFPTEHMRRILEAAEAGQSLLEFPVYDGSENGQRVYNTMTVIGHEKTAAEDKPNDAADQPQLDNLRRWPVTISYFDRNKSEGEQLPVYTISFELLENGISRALSLDYGDFVLAGDMTQLELKPATSCK